MKAGHSPSLQHLDFARQTPRPPLAKEEGSEGLQCPGGGSSAKHERSSSPATARERVCSRYQYPPTPWVPSPPNLLNPRRLVNTQVASVRVVCEVDCYLIECSPTCHVNLDAMLKVFSCRLIAEQNSAMSWVLSFVVLTRQRQRKDAFCYQQETQAADVSLG